MKTLRVLTCGVFFLFSAAAQIRTHKKDCRDHSQAVFSFVQLFSSHVIPLSATWNSA
ncbi:hypothetical protein BAXH7_00362 [Bacillus amyloliquefaciens XH7]|nr:hypothetical protein LL3_00359 [Bacillus amyloliquefaciens LL3]AEK87510.1 hypothetical protein BAXH7_00362 [Bacillus amyloliquefaciens XH7]KYC93003.1 hypothetical protein B425_0360 [Bacillus amyloliquefaciens]QBG54771.1 hypothetical protein D2M30_0406 [Bacillus amyloliquefaciens]